MPIVSAASKSSVITGTGGTLQSQSAAVADNQSGSGVAMEALALLNNQGSFDRAREFVGVGITGVTEVAEPTLQTLMSNMIVLMRAMLLAQVTANNLIGGTPADFYPDQLRMGDFI